LKMAGKKVRQPTWKSPPSPTLTKMSPGGACASQRASPSAAHGPAFRAAQDGAGQPRSTYMSFRIPAQQAFRPPAALRAERCTLQGRAHARMHQGRGAGARRAVLCSRRARAQQRERERAARARRSHACVLPARPSVQPPSLRFEPCQVVHQEQEVKACGAHSTHTICPMLAGPMKAGKPCQVMSAPGHICSVS